MIKTSIRFSTFPQTEPPPVFAPEIVSVFQAHEELIATLTLKKGLTSDQVLSVLRADLVRIGFDVEGGKRRDQRIERPVFYGENGIPTVRYQIDAYHWERHGGGMHPCLSQESPTALEPVWSNTASRSPSFLLCMSFRIIGRNGITHLLWKGKSIVTNLAVGPFGGAGFFAGGVGCGGGEGHATRPIALGVVVEVLTASPPEADEGIRISGAVATQRQ